MAAGTTDTKFRRSTGVTTANSTNKNTNANKLSWVINYQRPGFLELVVTLFGTGDTGSDTGRERIYLCDLHGHSCCILDLVIFQINFHWDKSEAESPASSSGYTTQAEKIGEKNNPILESFNTSTNLHKHKHNSSLQCEHNS